MNRMELIGRAGADAELRYLQTGTAVLEISLADSKKQGETWVTQWVRVVVYGERAEKLAPLIKKGTEVVAIGEYERREYTSRDGQKKTAEQLNASWIRACVSTKQDTGSIAL